MGQSISVLTAKERSLWFMRIPRRLGERLLIGSWGEDMTEQANIRVLQIPPTMFADMLPHVGPCLLKGLAPIDLTLKQACDEVVRGVAQLWAVLDGEQVLAAFMTSILLEGGVRTVSVFALGGKELTSWANALDGEMMKFAKSQSARCVRFAGREPWSRVLPAYQIVGHHPSGHALFERNV
jgi:hypothetical protein